MNRIAAIHQPNFFPWLGYFDKIARCDEFVVLDDVQYQKTGGSWSNRVKLLVVGEARWWTAPLQRPAHGTARIDELAWAAGPWRDKLLRTLEHNFAGHPFFRETLALVQPLLSSPEQNVAAYNLGALRALCDALGIRRELRLASRFAVAGASNERLVALTRAVACDTYLAGGGAQGYQQDAIFADAGIDVRYQAFAHPVYPQRGAREFVPGLSIIDALMNCGVAGTRDLLNLR